MSTAALPLLTALVAGFAHALEADHMSAVTAFVARQPHPLRALGFGVRWALGHSIAILLVGGVVIASGLRIPEALARLLEFGVGGLLLGLGVWVLGSALHGPSLGRDHAQAHTGARPHWQPPRLGRGSTWVGAAHGLAGTAGFVALLPAALVASPWLAGGYLLFFGVGTVAAMGLYALLAGVLLHRAGEHAPGLGRALRLVTGAASAVIGALWMYNAL